MKEAKAQFRFVRMSPRKIKVVMDVIRGKSVGESLIKLKFINRNAARVVENLLKSAVDNAVKDKKADADRLFISHAFADYGPTMKRFMPRAMGRAAMIRKRFAHATIVVREKEVKNKTVKTVAAKKPKASS